MTAGPVIGICAVREAARWAFWDQEAHLVADSYVAPLQRAGGVGVLLPVDVRAPLELLDRVDGLMLIGGADLDPDVYGAARDPATESVYPERDRFEIAMLRDAIDRGMPVLGICRGLQILNVALGGTLRAGPRGRRRQPSAPPRARHVRRQRPHGPAADRARWSRGPSASTCTSRTAITTRPCSRWARGWW